MQDQLQNVHAKEDSISFVPSDVSEGGPGEAAPELEGKGRLRVNWRVLWGFAAFLLVVLIVLFSQKPWQWADETTNPVVTEQGYTLVNDGCLTVAGLFDDAPFLYKDGLSVNGFTHELLETIASDMGLELKYYNARKASRFTPIIAEESLADIGVVQTTYNDTELEGLALTDPYFNVDQCVMVMKSSGIENVSELGDKRIGIVRGSSLESWTEKNLPNATVTMYPTLTDAMSDIRTGNLDAVMGDYADANYQSRVKYGNLRTIYTTGGTEKYGFVVKTDNDLLTKAINSELAQIKADGRYDELYEKWFTSDNDVDPYSTARGAVAMGDIR